MNWTGGTLQRSKTANKGIIQKQKAHFARARTQMQNGSKTPGLTSPGRLGLSCNEQGNSDVQLPNLGSRFSRGKGHGAVSNVRLNRKEPPFISHGLEVEASGVGKGSLTRHKKPDMVSVTREATSARSKMTRKASIGDPEEVQLEVSRKRLLQQQDWAGLTRSARVPMLSVPTEERKKMGKRRKLREHDTVTMLKSHSRSVPQLQSERNKQPAPDAIARLQDEKLQIRIGTDALSSLTVMQQSPAPSQAASTLREQSSDTMLFDIEDLHAAPDFGLDPSRDRDQDHRAFVGFHTEARAAPQHIRDERSQIYRSFNRKQVGANSSDWNNDPDAAWYQCGLVDGLSKGGRALCQEGRIESCQTTQYVGGDTHRSRCSSAQVSYPSAAVGENSASQGDVIGETIHACNSANAGRHQKGNDRRCSNARSVITGPRRIVDDSAWTPMIPVPEDTSSLTIAEDALEIDRPCYRPSQQPSKNRDAGSYSWSQSATQGDRTRIDSSGRMSVSLPSITRGCKRNPLGNRQHDGSKRGWRLRQKQREEDEKTWQAFVFGSEDDIETEILHRKLAGDNRHEAAYRALIPSSVAIAPLSSMPFQSVSTLTSCVSDCVQDAAVRAPLSTSSGSMLPMMASSMDPLTRAGFQGLSAGEGNDLAPQPAERIHSDLGGQSVTHTSVQNIVSSENDVSPSRLSGEYSTRVYRNGLDRGKGCKNDCFGPLQARRSDSASIYDIPVSSDDGLDLVDADKH